MGDQIPNPNPRQRTPWDCLWPTTNLPSYAPIGPGPPGTGWDGGNQAGTWDDGVTHWDHP